MEVKKFDYIKDFCINEYDMYGNTLQHGSNLIMIKTGNNKFVCLTPFEVEKILEQKRFGLYRIPIVEIYVDGEFKAVIDQKFNSMEIISTNKEKKLDYEGNKRKTVKVYTVKPVKRCEILGDYCNERDKFEEENKMEIENLSVNPMQDQDENKMEIENLSVNPMQDQDENKMEIENLSDEYQYENKMEIENLSVNPMQYEYGMDEDDEDFYES